ncbi:MAG: lipid-binding SYLF domain-containing protein [Methylobacter sp.]|nr:lipid-binding SYLF domain-containing protein [Methylobacter sp.]
MNNLKLNTETISAKFGIRQLTCLMLIAVAMLSGCQSNGVKGGDAMSAAEIDRDVSTALTTLYQQSPSFKQLAAKAKGVLVFPNVLKAGFIGGAQYGKGAMRKQGRTVGYYNLVAGSYGLQAGVQTFDYVLFFMNDAALAHLNSSKGFEVGVGPSIVVLDEGMARNITTTTARDDVYAVVFGQKGLMAGLGLQGSKITRIKP